MLARLAHRLRSRIAAKLAFTLVGFVAVAVLAAGLVLNRALEALAVQAIEARLVTAGRLLHDEALALVREGAEPDRLHAFAVRAARAGGVRVTLILPGGRVIGESDVPLDALARLENHAGRPEVQAALAGRIGRDLRTSATVDAPLLYLALPVEDAGRVAAVLRLALPLSAVTSSHRVLHRVMLLGGLVALAVGLGIGLVVARRLTRPVREMQAIAGRMSEGDFSARAPAHSPDELGQLGRALNRLAAGLAEKIGDLERERAKAAAILDGMVEGVLAVDGREHLLLVNQRARAMLGLPPGGGERRPLLEVVRHADLHAVVQAVRAGGGAAVRRELRLPAPGARVVQASAVPLPLAGGEVGVVTVLHDVTELRRLERVRTEFVANVSHELRTPLTAIRGYVETLLGDEVGDPASRRGFLEIVARHVERLGRLLDDLTDLSNIELGRVALRLEPTDLEEALDEALTVVQARAERGRVRVEARLPALPALRADRDRLVQILVNLVDNAVKFTPEGGSVTIGARRLSEALVEVAVSDTGVGIPPADLPRVTERFYRVDKGRSRELGGTGLGLAIVKHLVTLHGGELAIASEPGRGTTVRFTVPVAA